MLAWIKNFILSLLLRKADVNWVVNDLGELGVRVGGTYYFLYKGGSIIYADPHENGVRMLARPVKSREFGEVCRVPGLARTPDDRNGFYYEGKGWVPITPGKANTAPLIRAIFREGGYAA